MSKITAMRDGGTGFFGSGKRKSGVHNPALMTDNEHGTTNGLMTENNDWKLSGMQRTDSNLTGFAPRQTNPRHFRHRPKNFAGKTPP